MAQLSLSLSTIGAIDNGAAQYAINQAIANAVADLDDRGDDAKPRKVTIVLTLKKMDNGLVEADVEAKVTMPAFKTHATVAKVKRTEQGSRVTFQEFDSSDPDQNTFPSLDETPRAGE